MRRKIFVKECLLSLGFTVLCFVIGLLIPLSQGEPLNGAFFFKWGVALALVLARMPERIGKPLAVGLCAASAALFIWFYPVLSGLPVPELWAESLKVLPSFGFY